jgi:hypothetical protein
MYTATPQNNPRAHCKPPNASKSVGFSLGSGLEQSTRMTNLLECDAGPPRTGEAPGERSATSMNRYRVARAGVALLYAILPPTNVITGLMSLI